MGPRAGPRGDPWGLPPQPARLGSSRRIGQVRTKTSFSMGRDTKQNKHRLHSIAHMTRHLEDTRAYQSTQKLNVSKHGGW